MSNDKKTEAPTRKWGAPEQWGKLADQWPSPDELNPKDAPPSETNEVNRAE